MRVVRWSPQERVDVPDITAMSFLVLGEFRRHVRGALLGPAIGGTSQDADNFVVRGFKVEAQAVPDTTAIVRLDPGAPTGLGFAFMTENLGARLESGQLMGGNDSASRTEGNATTTVDFAALGLGAYFVETRFLYSEGANDNRAFWDPATNMEFIAATDTRFLPAYEVRIVAGVATDEWLALAGVTWDGVAVDPVDITDSRFFAFEGLANFYSTADSDQDSFDQFGDFDRSVDRGDDALSKNEVYPAMRALARQVRDLKGPAFQGAPLTGGVGMRWDWFSRPFAPENHSATALPYGDEHTKSLASVDTVTYTIGDGISSWGDFNGVTGLEDCFEAIDGTVSLLGRPRRIKIVLKSSLRTAGPTYVVTTPRDFTADGDVHIEIEGVSANDEVGDRGQVEIEFTGAGADFQWIQARGFTLKNLELRVTTLRQGLITTGELDAYNCVFQTTTDSVTFADLQAGNYAVDINRVNGAREVRIDSCAIQGGALRILDVSSDFTLPFNRKFAARITSSIFGANSPLILNDISDVAGTGTTRCSAGLIVEGCEFSQNSVMQTAYVGIVDARITENVTFRDCQFNGTTREADIIHCGAGAGVGTRPNPANLLIDNCLFNQGFVRSSAVDAGLNGVRGTGWSIFCLGGTGNPIEDASSITIRDCMFEGGTGISIDAGAIFMLGLDKAVLANNHFQNYSAGASERCRIIETEANGAAGQGRIYDIYGNQFSRFAGSSATGEVVCVYAFQTEGMRIHDNLFRGLTDLGASFVGSFSLTAAIVIQDNDFISVHDNHFEGFDVQAGCIQVQPVAGTGSRRFSIVDNTFDEVCGSLAGSYAIDAGGFPVEEGTISNNTIKTGALGGGINVTGTAEMVVNGNNVQGAASADPNGINWAATSVTSMCSGNRCNGQIIAGGGAGVIYGLQGSARNDLNFFP